MKYLVMHDTHVVCLAVCVPVSVRTRVLVDLHDAYLSPLGQREGSLEITKLPMMACSSS